MKKTSIFVALLMVITSPVFAGSTLKGPTPDKLPASEKCSACHNISKTYQELSQSAHKDLKCFDCHLPGGVQKQKYNGDERSFYHLGYHEKDGKWCEAADNNACLRCHEEQQMANVTVKCWSCHMRIDGMDRFVLVKDKKLPPTGNNIKKIKNLAHKSHLFKNHAQ